MNEPVRGFPENRSGFLLSLCDVGLMQKAAAEQSVNHTEDCSHSSDFAVSFLREQNGACSEITSTGHRQAKLSAAAVRKQKCWE